MARRLIPPPPIEDEDDANAWLVTYADAVTLLMAFFIMLVSFSKIDIPIYEQVKAGILNELGKRGETDRETSPTALLKVDLQDVIIALQAGTPSALTVFTLIFRAGFSRATVADTASLTPPALA